MIKKMWETDSYLKVKSFAFRTIEKLEYLQA